MEKQKKWRQFNESGRLIYKQEGSAHHSKLQQLEKKKRVQANCTVRSLQYVITQYSTHVHMIDSSWERGESHLVFLHQDLFKQDFFLHTETKKLDNTVTFWRTITPKPRPKPRPPSSSGSQLHSQKNTGRCSPNIQNSLNSTFVVCCLVFWFIYCFWLFVFPLRVYKDWTLWHDTTWEHVEFTPLFLFHLFWTKKKNGPLIGQFWWCHALEEGLCLFCWSCSEATSR